MCIIKSLAHEISFSISCFGARRLSVSTETIAQPHLCSLFTLLVLLILFVVIILIVVSSWLRPIFTVLI